jgi:N-acetylmuramoyl-L-alanine amidase
MHRKLVRCPLTLCFYCGKTGLLGGTESVASRANHKVLLKCAALCAAALALLGASPTLAHSQTLAQTLAQTQQPDQHPAAAYPIASDARLAGDTKQTRFVLDLDRTIQFRAFTLADPYRVVVDMPQVSFRLPAGTGATGRGLVKAFRYGLVMPGGSRIVIDLSGPAKITNSYLLDSANGQPPRLVLELEEVDRAAFAPTQQAATQQAAPQAAPQAADAGRPEMKPAIAEQHTAVPSPVPAPPPQPAAPPDPRPVVVIDPGHGGVDNGTQSGSEFEKNVVLAFALALRDRLEKSGKYRVVMTRTDDTFIPLGDRVKVARNQSAALFVSIHADALPKSEGDAQGATIYTLSDKASDAEAQRLADAENRADAIGGVNLTEEPNDVADILIDLVQRETRTFSNRFARDLMNEMKTSARMHKHPLKSAGFKVLKAPDVPSVLVELGYVSNKSDMENLVSDGWRSRIVGSMAKAIDVFLAKRLATAGSAN